MADWKPIATKYPDDVLQSNGNLSKEETGIIVQQLKVANAAQHSYNQIDHLPHFQWQFKSIASSNRGVVIEIADSNFWHYGTQKPDV